MSSIGKTIADARAAKGWSQSVLAERSGLSIDWVRKVEQGRSLRPSYDALIRASNALDIPVAAVMPGYRESGMDELEYVPKEQVDTINASLRTLKKLSPEGLEAAYKFLETFARMDEDEFDGMGRIPE